MSNPYTKKRMPRLTVDSWIRDRRGRVLLVQRARPPFEGRWGLPGGFCEWKETTEACCARETLEETGLRVRVGERAPSAAITHSASSIVAPSGVAMSRRTPSGPWVRPVTSWRQRSAIRSDNSAARAIKYSSTVYCCRLTKAGRRCPPSGSRSKR